MKIFLANKTFDSLFCYTPKPGSSWHKEHKKWFTDLLKALLREE
jgi:hypothetical protein